MAIFPPANSGMVIIFALLDLGKNISFSETFLVLIFYYAPTPKGGAGASCLLSYAVTFTTSNPALALLSNI